MTHSLMGIDGRLHGLTSSAFGSQSSSLSVGISEGCFIFHFITFRGRPVHLAYLVGKSGHKS